MRLVAGGTPQLPGGLPDETEARIQAGIAWYRAQQARYPTPPIPEWSPRGLRQHEARVRRSMALLIATQSERPAVEALTVELDETRERCERLRLRADLGHDLAEAQSKVMELSALLLTDERFSAAETGPIRMPGPRRGRSVS